MSSEPEPSNQDRLIGQTFGDEFLITEKLGEGGMGAVYLATQKLTERQVAVKVLGQSLYDQTLIERFKQEAQIVSKLSHPNIITIYKYGRHTDGTLYIAMEFVRGSTLGELLDSARAFDVDRALPLMIQMADALAYAHDQKIVHRDIKPDNMIVTRTGRNESVKILDFGIAKMLDGNAALTRTGSMCGSPIFMSPEQWESVRDIDGRTDIYSLGCVYYQMMVGRPPHEADSTIGYMHAHTSRTPVPPAEVSNTISQLPQLNEIIVRCLQTARADRYPDAYALLDALKDAEGHFAAGRRGAATPAPRSDAPAGPVVVESPSTLVLQAPEPAVIAAPVSLAAASAAPERAAAAEGTSAFRVPAVPAVPAKAEPDRVHLVLSGIGAVMLTLLALAVFATR